jgi:hypothetical protein
VQGVSIQEQAMKHPLSFLAGLLAGACAMYYLDEVSGPARRARLRALVAGSGSSPGRMTPATDMQPEDASGDEEGLGSQQAAGRPMSPGGTPWH